MDTMLAILFSGLYNSLCRFNAVLISAYYFSNVSSRYCYPTFYHGPFPSRADDSTP